MRPLHAAQIRAIVLLLVILVAGFSIALHQVGKGLGLGLSVSYNIVRDFGGRLSMRNHPEGGAEFTIQLQAAAQMAQAAE